MLISPSLFAMATSPFYGLIATALAHLLEVKRDRVDAPPL